MAPEGEDGSCARGKFSVGRNVLSYDASPLVADPPIHSRRWGEPYNIPARTIAAYVGVALVSTQRKAYCGTGRT